ncbi:Yos1-like protein [Acaromyces ingoldii]|uniref:Yos1-like protein n=1 Tax=Acaromyces ingoldii TaxID=215250 RepID=A0A316YHA5_9BASI|nr:Yos1-like protein [Acaromyces ingoldii]PWN88579.1 Yos1-like protein [Acaromyces ingoldii]
MASTLGTFLYVALLLVNAIAILNEERFLARVGWSTSQLSQRGFNGFSAPGGEPGIKERLINLIGAVRMLLRIPLIVFNIVIIIYELI